MNLRQPPSKATGLSRKVERKAPIRSSCLRAAAIQSERSLRLTLTLHTLELHSSLILLESMRHANRISSQQVGEKELLGVFTLWIQDMAHKAKSGDVFMRDVGVLGWCHPYWLLSSLLVVVILLVCCRTKAIFRLDTEFLEEKFGAKVGSMPP